MGAGLKARPYVLWAVAGVIFAVIATANAGGYRYGVSDQAFYIPVVLRALDPSAFPRDAMLIDAQGHLMLLDEFLAALVRATGIPLDLLFFIGYVCSLALIWSGLVRIGARVYRSPWATIGLGLLFTLRHRIPRTSANSFEPYFHPRMLAFGIGVLAVDAVLRRKPWLAIALVAVSALVHVTTAMWFAVMLGVAIAWLDARLRPWLIPAAVVAGLAAAALVAVGPLRTSLVRMDAIWLQAVAGKDSLFPGSDWPLWAWALNLVLLPVAWLAVSRWRPSESPVVEMRALLWGATALVALFLITLPLVEMRLALPVQLQISRVFWLVDFIATICVVGAMATTSSRVLGTAALVLAVIPTAGRALYVMTVEHPERSLVDVHLQDSSWTGAMMWIRQQPRGIHVLADPGHAWKYGTSVRVSGERDVFLEEVKDAAIAMYSRDVAVRVVERTAAIGDFSALTAERAHDLASRYQIDFLVTEATLPLPLAYENDRFRIYRLS